MSALRLFLSAKKGSPFASQYRHVRWAFRWPRWSLPLFLGALLPAAGQQNMVIYDDALQNAWSDWSYNVTRDFGSTAFVHSGSKAIAVTLTTAWGALSLHHANDVDTSSYSTLSFWINGGSSGGQLLQVYAELDSGAQPAVALSPLQANTWTQVSLSLASLGVANQPNFIRFSIQDRSNSGTAPTYYVDDITLLTNGAPPVTNIPVTLSVDAQSNSRPISPLIYGVAFASSNQLSELNFTMNRSGGNNETRYNWLINAHNIDADWYFETIADSSATPGATADDFVANSKKGGAQPLITIPMIGWACKLGPSRGKLSSYSIAKYGPQTGNDSQWLPDAGNGIGTNSTTHTTWQITTNDPNDANFATNSVFEQGYVQHLMAQWGSSTNGGVPYYIMDNEHSIWFETHQDVHPVGPTMQEIRDRIFDYAGMVKSNDPNALVCAPEEFGWSGYFFSGYDQQWSGQHNDFNTADYPDRKTNGGWDYMPWLLDQIHQHDVGTGQRLLDYFTLHSYPQSGEFGDDVSGSMQLLRNQTTREFWDTNYVDPSWIGQQPTNKILMVIPRMRNWVNAYYPGTKIGITEYNWGAEGYINGATAQADILGIFGREGLDLSTRWTTPTNTSPTFKAMKMYRNYDGNKSTFGDTSVSDTVSTNVDLVSSFAAVRSSDNALTVMVINKQLSVTATVTLNLANFTSSGTAQAWQLTSNNVITRLADLSVATNSLRTTVPAQSITLFVLPPGAAAPPPPALSGGFVSPPGFFNFTLNGQAGKTYVVVSSADLTSSLSSWTPVATNTLSGSSSNLVFSVPGAALFYRARWAGY